MTSHRSVILAVVATASLCLTAPFAARAASNEGQTSAERTITVDYADVKGPTSQVFRQCVGAGRANEGLRADWQQQLAHTVSACGFQYIRMHGLFTDDMGVYSEDSSGRPTYNWQYVDRLYDFLLSIHIRPFVELVVTLVSAIVRMTPTRHTWTLVLPASSPVRKSRSSSKKTAALRLRHEP